MSSMRCLALLTLGLIVAGSVRADEVLENEHIRVLVAPAQAGSVVLVHQKHADTFPYYGERGVIGGGLGMGVAGAGSLFMPNVRIAGAPVDLASAPLQPSRTTAADGEQVLTLSGAVPGVTDLTLEREIRMARDESGFRITDRFTNGGADDIELSLGGESKAAFQDFMATVLTGFGDASTYTSGKGTMSDKELSQTAELPSSPVYWRMVSQWGVGLLYQVRGPQGAIAVTHDRLLRTNGGVGFKWAAAPISLPAGGSVEVEQAVLIDTGAREASVANTASLVSADRVVVTPDLRAAGRSGDTLPGAATVVSATPRRVKLVVMRSGRAFAGGESEPRIVVEQADITLVPGQAVIRPLWLKASKPGLLRLDFEVRGESGQLLAAAHSEAVIDGAKQPGRWADAWNAYDQRMPEQVYRGTWREIGAQLAQAGKIRAPKTPNPRSAATVELYRRKFPFYADLLEGAASVLKLSPEQLASSGAPAAAVEAACMDVFFNGPDGPINAFSKERHDAKMNGLGYIKMLPTEGYSYHMYYMPPGTWEHGYGVNSAGLSTSGATRNADKATEAEGEQHTKEWKESGRPVAPIPMHMLLSRCRTVDEALAMIDDPEAPIWLDGNVLIVDRDGNAARVESAGLLRQVHRYGKSAPSAHDPKDAYFVAGNYTHDAPDGRFKAGGWSYTTNTMLREQFLCKVAPGRMGQLSLQDVMGLMETHAAGGMCQHIYENRARLYTSASFLAVSRTGDLWLSQGPPCQVQYVRYTLDDEPQQQASVRP